MRTTIIIIFFLWLSLIIPSSTYAQTITLPATESANIASQPASIQYDYPYPGILPDHPLYFLKVARDHLVGFLINDPIKKAEFNVLQSDKKIFAARMLLEKDSDQLGVDTLSKSNNYMHKAISDAKRAYDAKLPTVDIIRKIGNSIDKHKESVEEMIASESTVDDSLKGELERLESIEEYYEKSFSKK